MHFDIFGTITFGQRERERERDLYPQQVKKILMRHVKLKKKSHLDITAKIYSERNEFQFSGP